MVDVRELVETFTIDTIARVIYGIEAHTVDHPDSSYRKHRHEVFQAGSWWLPNLANIKSKLTMKRSFVWLDQLREALNKKQQEQYEKKDDLIDILVETSVIKGGPLDLHTLEKLSEMVSTELRLIAPTMLFTFFELSWAENAQTKLRDEILQHNKEQLSYGYIASNDNFLAKVIRGNYSLFNHSQFIACTFN